MKPTSHRTASTKHSGAEKFESRPFPVIDCAYQSVAIDDYRESCADNRLPSFRSISDGYFTNEARYSFLSEAAFFAVMVAVSSWPLVQSVHAMTSLVRGISGL